MSPRRSQLLGLAVLVATPLLLASCRSGSTPAEDGTIPVPERIVVIGIDTLRPDHLPFYGYGRDTVPNLAHVAEEEGVVFENAYASSSWTLPSMASVFTSLHPIQHGVVDRDYRLGEVPTLAGELSSAGWTTAALVNHFYVSSLFGFDRGFDQFHEIGVARDFSELDQVRADVVVRTAVEWIEEHADRRFYLYLHLFDPHWNYDAPAPWGETFTDPSYDGPATGRWTYLRQFLPPDRLMPPRDLQHVKDLYDGEILFTDQALGRLFASLRAEDLWDDALVIILSDHGEEFQEHGSVHHVRTLMEEVLRVPLLLKPPGGRPGWMRPRIGERVRNLDVAPTILELSGVEPPPTFEGRSLVELLGSEGEGREIFAHTQRYESDKASLHVGDEKLIHQFTEGRERVALFDLAEDPAERENLAAVRWERTQALVRELSDAMASMLGRTAPRPENAPELSDEVKESLEALGYVE